MPSLYTLQFTQRAGTKNAVSTWNLYNDTINSTGFCDEFAADFVARMVPVINAMQCGYMENISVYVLNATNGLCSHYQGVSGTGVRGVTDDLIPPYFVTATVRWGLSETQYGPRTTLIKRGFTRFGGLRDTDIDKGKLTDTFIDDLADPIVNEWKNPVTLGGYVFLPVIHVPDPSPANAWKIAPITGGRGWRIGSQNTRKQR